MGKISPQDFHTNLCAYLKVGVLYEDFVKFWNRILIKPNKNYCDFLKKAKKAGYTLILLSNIDVIHWERSCEICKDLPKLFRRIFLSCDVGLAKPDPMFLAHVFYEFRIKRQDAIFIDDKLENIKAARSLGIPSILYNSKKHNDFLAEFKTLCPDFPAVGS
ncbi:MAG: HAD-IA family hydrolase [Patescibacteria group bacterium]